MPAPRQAWSDDVTCDLGTFPASTATLLSAAGRRYVVGAAAQPLRARPRRARARTSESELAARWPGRRGATGGARPTPTSAASGSTGGPDPRHRRSGRRRPRPRESAGEGPHRALRSGPEPEGCEIRRRVCFVYDEQAGCGRAGALVRLRASSTTTTSTTATSSTPPGSWPSTTRPGRTSCDRSWTWWRPISPAAPTPG